MSEESRGCEVEFMAGNRDGRCGGRGKRARRNEGSFDSLSPQRPASTNHQHLGSSCRKFILAHLLRSLAKSHKNLEASPPSLPPSAQSSQTMSSSSSPPLSIPLISLSPFKPATVLAEEVSNACKTSGFLYITDHGIPQEQIDRAFQISAQFFEGEEQNEKEKVGITIGNKGVSDYFACWTGQYLALEGEELCAGRRRREKEKVEGEIRAFRFELN